MIKTAKESGINVLGTRLLTREEFLAHETAIPAVSWGLSWWLADEDPMDSSYIAYVDGNSTDEDMYCSNAEANTYIRLALDMTGGVAGESFEWKGYVFTALTENLAISNNVLGSGKYLDEEILPYLMDEDVTCTLEAVIETMLDVPEA